MFDSHLFSVIFYFQWSYSNFPLCLPLIAIIYMFLSTLSEHILVLTLARQLTGLSYQHRFFAKASPLDDGHPFGDVSRSPCVHSVPSVPVPSVLLSQSLYLEDYLVSSLPNSFNHTSNFFFFFQEFQWILLIGFVSGLVISVQFPGKTMAIFKK